MSGVGCDICPHNCKGVIGICGEREKNLNLYSAINMDPIEKKPLYHVYPGEETLSLGGFGCNLKCPWCQNYHISKQYNTQAAYTLTPEDIEKLAKEHRAKTVTFTYNEPSVAFEAVRDSAKLLKEIGIETLMVSNGYISPIYLQPLYENIRAVNIDLKCFNPETYKKIIGGDLDTVKGTLEFLSYNKTWLEITTLLIPGLNDTKEEISQMVEWIIDRLGDTVPLHFSAFYPTYLYAHKVRTKEETVIDMVELAKGMGLKYVYPGNIRTGDSSTYCPSCNSEIISRSGYNTRTRVKGGCCPDCSTKIDGVFR